MRSFIQWFSNYAFTIANILGSLLLLVGTGLILRPHLTGTILRYGYAGLNIYMGIFLLTRSLRRAGGR